MSLPSESVRLPRIVSSKRGILGRSELDRFIDLPTLRFCTMRQLPPLESLRQIRLDDLLLYMRWYLDKHDVKKLNTFYVRMRFWRMMYAEEIRPCHGV